MSYRTFCGHLASKPLIFSTDSPLQCFLSFLLFFLRVSCCWFTLGCLGNGRTDRQAGRLAASRLFVAGHTERVQEATVFAGINLVRILCINVLYIRYCIPRDLLWSLFLMHPYQQHKGGHSHLFYDILSADICADICAAIAAFNILYCLHCEANHWQFCRLCVILFSVLLTSDMTLLTDLGSLRSALTGLDRESFPFSHLISILLFGSFFSCSDVTSQSHTKVAENSMKQQRFS